MTALDHFWTLVGWVFALNGEAFRLVSRLPQGWVAALIIVLVAGLSQAIAQIVILFVNRVKPVRFVFSLLINAVLFVASALFLVISTWLIILVLPGMVQIPFLPLTTVLGISYAPLVFSFLGALPYLGVPILTFLSIWHFLAMVVGVAAIAHIGLGNAVGYVGVGWVALQVTQRTVGRPIAWVGRQLANAIAGVELVTHPRDVMELVSDRIETASVTWQDELRERLDQLGVSMAFNPLVESPAQASPDGVSAGWSATGEHQGRSPSVRRSEAESQNWGAVAATALGLLGMALLTYLVVVFLEPVQVWLSKWYVDLPRVIRFIFDLSWIGVLAIVVAGLIAPLETLGWWAGWYDDEVDTTVNAGELVHPVGNPDGVSRYIVYLDGIGKSTFEYLPDIEEFLNTLTPRLPEDVALIRGIMPYSVVNNPLDEDRPLAFLWKAADQARLANPMALLGLLVNIRNVIVVGVSADKRYGPLYNQGIAQVVYNGLIKNGYVPDSSTPITLMGYSGGGQMACACAPFLKRALSAPIDVISLGGVISGNCNVLKLEHLYHLVGEKDGVEQIGPIMFPGRWKLFPLSFWNRAKRKGKVSILSMGPVGHQVPGGLLDPHLTLDDGRSALQQTLDYIDAILKGDILPEVDLSEVKPSNYSLYKQAAFTHPDYYPIQQSLDPVRYRAIAPWMGRLILPAPDKRQQVKGALFEVHHAPEPHQHLIGQTLTLRWANDPTIQRLVRAVTKDVHFSAEAEYTSKYGGLIHPDRLNHWQQVRPLESLAGAHPVDDITVMLRGDVTVDEANILRINAPPAEITGQGYGLVKFIEPVGDEQYRVAHFNADSRQFDGGEEVVSMPAVMADQNGCFPSTSRAIETSPLNEMGWYVYGAQDHAGQFVVQSLAPRSLLRLQPDRVVFGRRSAYQYIRKDAWADIVAQKGKISSVLCTQRDNGTSSAIQAAIEDWTEGDRALVLHVYGGIGGNKREPAAFTPIFFGHFAYGFAEVVRDPLADELRFDIQYYQIYTHNPDGIVSGTLHWSQYMGDRQWGWAGLRPVCDILVKLEAFTGFYDFDGVKASPFNSMIAQLSAMAARYRIGDGTGGTYVGPANNCAQDSNQALFASIQSLRDTVDAGADMVQDWAERNPDQAADFDQLMKLGGDLRRQLQLFGKLRPDWEKNEYNLGSTLEDEPLRNLMMGLGSWRALLPRKASDTIVKTFLDYGASVWVLRTNQIGGVDPDIEPIAPMTL